MRNSALHIRHYLNCIHQYEAASPQLLLICIPYSCATKPMSFNPNPSNPKARISQSLTTRCFRQTHFILQENSFSDCRIVFQEDVFLANLLLYSYKKSGCIVYARKLFDRMPERNSVLGLLWFLCIPSMGRTKKHLRCFRSSDGKPNEFTLPSVIRACTQFGGVDHGAQVHSFVVKTGFDQEVFVGTSLIDFYAKSGDIEEARLIFDSLKVKSAVTWAIVIAGYVKSGRSEVSLELFNQMRVNDILPDKYVLSAVLTTCSALKFIGDGKQIHAYVLRRGREMDVSVVNVLIDLYTKCGQVQAGQKLFDKMVVKDLISWTTMIAGYMENSMDWEAVKLFSEMTRLGWKPDGYGCSSILTSCGSLDALKHGREVHAYTIRVDLVYEYYVKNCLIDMYAKCDSVTDARRVFDSMTDHNVVSYND